MVKEKILGLWYLTPLPTTFQLYLGSQFIGGETEVYPVKTRDLLQVPNEHHYIKLHRVHLAMSGIRTYNFSGDRHWLHK